MVFDVDSVLAFDEQDDLHHPGRIDEPDVDQGDLVRQLLGVADVEVLQDEALTRSWTVMSTASPGCRSR